MGTVGINFGSLSSGAGFDVASTVTAILAIQQGIETPWKTQLTQLAAQDTALSGLGTTLATLSTSLSALTNFDGVLATKQGSSSATGVLTLTSASPASVAGSHTIQVTSLASTSSVSTGVVASAKDGLSGTLTLGAGTTAAQLITIDATDNTLATLAQKINNGSYGVTANIVTDSTGSRLSLVSTTSGQAGTISLTSALTDTTSANSVAFSVAQKGLDAVLNVDGLDTTSASNTVTGAIPGVTFQLLSSSPGTDVQVQITNDNASVETALQTLVTSYNAVITAAAAQEKATTTGVANPLFGSTVLSHIQGQLSQALTGGGTSGSISSIEQLGITVNPDGSLVLDVSALDAKLNANYAEVTGYLQNSGSFGQTFSTILNSLSSTSKTGSIALALQENTAQEALMNANIAKQELLLVSVKTNLTKELNLANEELQAIPQQLDEVNQIYSAITGYNQNH
jgi:flagellar hook-associated protein 2